MASNYKHLSEDFDDLFAPRATTKRADVGYKTAGTDISNTYEKLGRDQQIPNIGYSQTSTDLATLFMGNVSQYSTASKLTSQRTTAWNTKLIHEWTTTFLSSTARLEFFKFGGRVMWSATRTGGSATSKNTSWTNLLSSAGNIELGKTNTYKNGTTTTSVIGLDDLTNAYQTLYTEAGSGSYTGNSITIRAKVVNTHSVTMQAIFDDGTSGTVDEDVDGTLTSTIDERRHPSQTTPTFRTSIAVSAGS